MFRLYGKKESKEGTGIYLVFNHSFFRDLEFDPTNPAQPVGGKEQRKHNSDNESKLPL